MTAAARRTLLALGLLLVATPAAAQWCDFDISVYADGAPSGYYDASGNGELDYWGSGYDYSYNLNYA
jgi:hypothetical protein